MKYIYGNITINFDTTKYITVENINNPAENPSLFPMLSADIKVSIIDAFKKLGATPRTGLN